MSHSNGRIYIDRTVTPNIGINTFDVAYVLGRSTDDICQLCGDVDGSGNSVGSVNPKGLIKPMRSASPGVLSTAQRRAGNYGYNVGGYYTADLAFVNHASNFGWLKPRGASQSPAEWYRLTDFDGYEHGADWPFIFSPRGTTSFYQDGSGVFNCELPSDIFQWAAFSGDWYIGIMVERGGTKYYYPVTTETSALTTADVLAAGQFSVTFPSGVFSSVGQCTAVLMLTDVGDVPQTWTQGSPDSGLFIAFPIASQFSLITGALNMSASVDYWTGRNYAGDFFIDHVFVPIVVNAPSGMVTNMWVELYADDYSQGSTPRRIQIARINSVTPENQVLDFDCQSQEVESPVTQRVDMHLTIHYTWGGVTSKTIHDLNGGIGYIDDDNKQ